MLVVAVPSPTVPICPYGWDTKALTLVVRQRKGLELQILPCQLGWELKDAKAHDQAVRVELSTSHK